MLGLSQPQVSRHVAGLERELGVALFTRTARSVELTDAAAELLPDAREALQAAARLRRRAGVVARGQIGTVSVGFIWSTLPAYLPPLVSVAGARHPQIELMVSQLRFTQIVSALRRGEVDLVITRPYLGETELIVTKLNTEPGVVAIPEGHPLADRDSLFERDLDGVAMITLSRETIPSAFDHVAARFAAAGVRPSTYRGASSPSEALALVAAGLGIYYRLPISAIVPQAGIVYRELVDRPMRTLLVRQPAPPAPAVAAIAALAAELFGDAPHASNYARAGLEAMLAAP